MVQFVARPVRIANSRAFLFRTGSTPGMPMQIWQVWVVRLIAEGGRAAAEDLGACEHLRMDFKAYDRFPFHRDGLLCVPVC